MLGFTCEDEAEGWCRLTRDGATIMFMTNDHLGEPHATATQYFYVDDASIVWDALKDRCAAE